MILNRHIVKRFIVPAVAAVTGCMAITACSSDKSDSGKDADTNTPVVDVATPLVDSVTIYKTYPGYLTANAEVELVARVNGYLLSHPYQGGDFVRKGQVLFVIESKQYVDAVNQAKAQLSTAQSQYEYASKNYAAMQKALESDAVSKMEVLQSKNSMEAAAAAINNARAALESAQTTLSYCTVRAPFDGHITSTPFSDGAYLSGGVSPVSLAHLYDDAIMTANFNIDDDDLIALVNNGGYTKGNLDLKHIPVEFGDTLPHTYTADLSYMSPVLDVSTGQMVVQAHIQNSYGELRPGMVTSVKFPSKFVPDGIMIQDAAISKDQLGSYVYIVNDSNKVVYTPITTGDLVTPTMRLVTKGLKSGDKYVTKAMLKVRDGMTVKPRIEGQDTSK